MTAGYSKTVEAFLKVQYACVVCLGPNKLGVQTFIS